jgi:branched-chain amino acid aminotransferase
MILWLDGKLTAVDAARIDPRDRGFTLGDGLYETIRVRDGTPQRLDRHFARLADGLIVLGYPLTIDRDRLAAAMDAVLQANGLAGDAALRLTVSRGVAPRGMAPDPTGHATIMISAAPYAPPAPVRAIIAKTTRRNEFSPTARVKVTSCLDSILARIEATARNADEAILLNTVCNVAETTIGNVFAVIGGRLVTPPVTDGALPGIMRGWICENSDVVERSLNRDDLTAATELFFTSSLGIRPAIELDGRALDIGPLTRLAQGKSA